MHDDLDKFCPVCTPVFNRKKPEIRDGVRVEVSKNYFRTGVRLEIVSSNYSGCGVDICVCPQCQKRFQVSYRVDEIIHLPV